MQLTFPHCDEKILHAPGVCDYCDKHPDWQALREVWGINYTGHVDPSKHACPAEVIRHLSVIQKWGGNIPKKFL